MSNLQNKSIEDLFHSWLNNKNQKQNHITIYSLKEEYIEQIRNVMQGCLDGKVTFGKVCQKLHFYIINNIDYTEYSWLERISVNGTHITEINMKKQYGNEIGLQKWNHYIERQRFHMSEAFYVKKYGEEEGKRKWKEYCDRQAYTCSFEYMSEKRGMTKEEFDNFNKSRAVTKENMIKKYGEEEGKRKWKEYCDRQAYTNTEDYFIEKLGIEEGKKKYKQVNKQKVVSFETFIRKYGEIEGRKKWSKFIDKTIYYSKISQELFSILDKFYGDLYKNIYYGITEKGEYFIFDEKDRRYYFYDFVIEDIKFAIEFNGDYWHCNPLKYKKDDLSNMFGGKRLKAEEIWKKDKYKNDKLKKRGFELMVIWESEYKKNPKEVFDKIKNKIEKLNLQYKIKINNNETIDDLF